jgi:hypothetical protein
MTLLKGDLERDVGQPTPFPPSPERFTEDVDQGL